MKQTIDVLTGEVAAGGSDILLRSNALGSCVALVLFDPLHQTGGLAHIMLPGRQGIRSSEVNTRYAENAIDQMLRMMNVSSEDQVRLSACLVGGGMSLIGEMMQSEGTIFFLWKGF